MLKTIDNKITGMRLRMDPLSDEQVQALQSDFDILRPLEH